MPGRMLYLGVALLSGIPALVYEVVWTREVALVLGGQVEATSLVLAAFFAGLALGAHAFGTAADRTRSPLRLVAALELAAALLAPLSLLALSRLGSEPALVSLPYPLRLALCGAALLPVALPLGGTLPSLLRAAETDANRAPRTAGRLVAANTTGALLGVSLATALVPASGLLATLHGAALGEALLGATCFVLAARVPVRSPGTRPSSRETPRRLILVAAGLAGGATLAFEVLAARMAALLLGSSLLAWSAVLSLLLGALAGGSALFAARAARTPHPERDLGWIETGAAATLGIGLFALAPQFAEPARGPSLSTLLSVGMGVLPPALLMGAAFPFFVRLAVHGPASLGRAFGSVSAVNTAGGVAGSLAAPWLLIPSLGVLGGAIACAALNASLGIAFLLARAEARCSVRAVVAAGIILACMWPTLTRGPRSSAGTLLFVADGRQARAVVVHTPYGRDLWVDGEHEASTAGSARATEELLALLPLVLHPRPRRFLEVGLGSGISLGTATRLPLERIDCVEIARSVIEAARFFVPDNGNPTAGHDPRLRIYHADGRAFLAAHPSSYDVIVANTLHPWSVGATGLYSREYFARVATGLLPGGIAVQWIPVERIRAHHLAAILRSFFAVFPQGGLWWGAANVLAVGSSAPLAAPDPEQFRALPGRVRAILARQGLADVESFGLRRLANAQAVRLAIGPGEILADDRPLLEEASLGRQGAETRSALSLLVRVAKTGVAAGETDPRLRAWIESLLLRAAGNSARAEQVEHSLAREGLPVARRARSQRISAEADSARGSRRFSEARRGYARALSLWPTASEPRFGLAIVAFEQGELRDAAAELRRLVAQRPDHARAWNLLGVVQTRRGDRPGATRAFAQSLAADPFLPQALANAGLTALAGGELAPARHFLARLRALESSAELPELRALRDAIERGSGRPRGHLDAPATLE